ncbi:MAG: hypothetical protein DPW16_17475 [Chloroflexi bacterium]|nr:hypothetical protein [Chloroflexota bacterium]
MRVYVLDTNIVSLILRRDPNVTIRFQEALRANATIIGCAMVWYEVRRGLLAKDAKKQMQMFETMFADFTWEDYTLQDWTLATDLWAKRRRLGKPIEDADLLIGAFTLNRNAILITDNEKDFVDLGLTIENWQKP